MIEGASWPPRLSISQDDRVQRPFSRCGLQPSDFDLFQASISRELLQDAQPRPLDKTEERQGLRLREDSQFAMWYGNGPELAECPAALVLYQRFKLFDLLANSLDFVSGCGFA